MCGVAEATSGDRRPAVPDRRLYSTKEAAYALNVSYSWLKHQVSSGKVVHTRLGRTVRFTDEQIDALVADPATFTGAAGAQVQNVIAQVNAVLAAHAGAAAYVPPPIL